MCDTLVVIWPDGVGFAKNSDRDPNEAQRLEWKPAAEHSVGATLRCTWVTIPQVRRTRSVLLSRPFWMWGAEMGANDAGVVVGNEAVFTRRPINKTGLTGMDLVRLALERAESAEHAVDVITDLIQTNGQGGRCGYSDPGFRYHNSFLIADYRGAYVLETAGSEVAMERVNQGVRAISNGLTIPKLLHHADRLRGRVAQCHLRRFRMEHLGKMASRPKELALVLRDHGGLLPSYQRLTGALSAPCVHYGGMIAGTQTVASWVSYLTADRVQHWATGTSAPCISMFRPLSMTQPREVGAAEGHSDPQSLWWRFEKLHRRWMLDWSAAQQLKAERDKIELDIFARPADEEEHWLAADQWLTRGQERLDWVADRRPKWLRDRWGKIIEQAMEGNRMPPRNER